MKEERRQVSITVEVSKDQLLNVFARSYQRTLKGEDYVRIFSDELMEIAKDRRLAGSTMRVLLAIIANLEFENQFTMPVAELGMQIGQKRQNTDKEIRTLINLGYLLPVRKSRQVVVYMFNPNVAFKTRANKLDGLKKLWKDLIQTLTPKEDSRVA